MPDIGAMHAASFVSDPKHLGFVLRRYHFVARMLQGASLVLEVGCGDGTGAQIVKQVVGEWIGIDIDPIGSGVRWDIARGPFWTDPIEAVYALDVLEHIPKDKEDIALSNMRKKLKPFGTCIIGMPSKESQPYASALSKQHHVNCKTEGDLRTTMERHYHAVFMFGLNDYTLHDGYGPMCHYRFAVCVGGR
jgi:predicted SAM-dependent methyltransferase